MEWIDRQVSYRYKGGIPLTSSNNVSNSYLYNTRNIDTKDRMSDCCTREDTVIRFNRPYGSNLSILWPLHDYDCRNLVDDIILWDDKKDILFWRGATSGFSVEERIEPIRTINNYISYCIPMDCKFSCIIQDREKDIEPHMIGEHTQSSW